MERLINKYVKKLEDQMLAEKDAPVFIALDAWPVSNKKSPDDSDFSALLRVFGLMNINSILYSPPSPVYRMIIRELAERDEAARRDRKVVPIDCETRTFFHDIPVLDEITPEKIAAALSKRKSAITKDGAIISYGVVTPEQAFVSFSSTCFSLSVKYFYDSLLYLEGCYKRKSPPEEAFIKKFLEISSASAPVLPGNESPRLIPGPPETVDEIMEMLAQAGRAVVENRLVDSYFGNISYIEGGLIHISQTGSSLDELEGCIDSVPLDGSSSVGITASSELSAHKGIHALTGANAILHAHPRFPVIMSLLCEKEASCPNRGFFCHKACPEKRYAAGIPVVPRRDRHRPLRTVKHRAASRCPAWSGDSLRARRFHLRQQQFPGAV